ncbi:MAG: murein biosynthesis integral membrane protein MurJ [Chloroflexota bacterium]
MTFEADTSRASGFVRAGLVLSGTFLISRVLGYIRTVVLGTTFGAGPELDTFFAAFRLPDLIFQIVAAGAMGSALIPVLSGLLATGDRARAWRVVGTVVNLMLVVLAVLAVAAFVAAPVLVRLVTPGFDDQAVAMTTDLTRVMLVAPVLLALGSVATSTLNAEGRFTAAAMAPIVYNLAIISGAVLLGPSLGITGLAVGVVVGAFGHLAIQLPAVWRLGFRPRFGVDLGDAAARRVLILLGPRALGLGVSQLTFVVMTALASSLGEGSISAYSIAFAVLQIPLGLIGIPLGIVIFPTLSRDHALGATATFVHLVTRSLRLIGFVTLPIAALGIALRTQVVALLFGYGRFDGEDIDRTAATFGLFLIGLTAHSAIAILARTFYAQQDTRRPVAAAILAVIVNISLGVILVGPMGLPGLALAIALAAWIEAAVLLVMLGRRERAFDVRGLLAALGLSLAAAAMAGAAAAGVVVALGDAVSPGATRPLLVAGMVSATAVGSGLYLMIARVLKMPELEQLIGIARARIGGRMARG